jgi:hypothetical protein
MRPHEYCYPTVIELPVLPAPTDGREAGTDPRREPVSAPVSHRATAPDAQAASVR